MSTTALARLRALCLALPEAREVEAWGAPTFRVKTMFAAYSAPDAPGARPAAWIKATPANQELLVAADAGRFFVPPYVGPRGWVGVHLDGPGVDWSEIGSLLADGWRMSAPKKLVALHPAL